MSGARRLKNIAEKEEHLSYMGILTSRMTRDLLSSSVALE